jgi:hypothetical protein
MFQPEMFKLQKIDCGRSAVLKPCPAAFSADGVCDETEKPEAELPVQTAFNL